jgi:dienelactone hydrolase
MNCGASAVRRFSVRRPIRRLVEGVLVAALCLGCVAAFAPDPVNAQGTFVAAEAPPEEVLPGTEPLTEARPLDEVMVAGIDRFALREIDRAASQRESRWELDESSPAARTNSLEAFRQKFCERIGVVDSRVEARGIELIATVDRTSFVATNDDFEIHAVRWPVLDGIDAEGLFLRPKEEPIARVIALPDADWTPEMISALEVCPTQFAAELAALRCEVLIPTLVNRDHRFSRNESIGRSTNLTHREFIYRQAFELGRHVIGYEVQKVLAAVDQFEHRNSTTQHDLPIGVFGVSEGGLLALYSGAIDPRLDCVVVSGYFDAREKVWREPIYRNVWGLLTDFGDAELAAMVAPRLLYVEHDVEIPEVHGPPDGARNIAAPGVIVRPESRSARQEADRARSLWNALSPSEVATSNGGFHQSAPTSTLRVPLDRPALREIIGRLVPEVPHDDAVKKSERVGDDFPNVENRQRRAVEQMTDFTQRLLRLSHRERDRIWGDLDRSSVDAWVRDAAAMRERIHRELIGKLPGPTVDPNPRTRKILQDDGFTGYEVVLDVYPDVIAAGILLLPRDLKLGDRRPVVVCQHGLEGTPMDTITGPGSPGYRAYKAFSAELARSGYIVYAPQNPYRGRDAFRTLQRKSNPLRRSLFSYIIEQHRVTLRWLASLDYVDADRIGFYGLSYGGKTAVRVPPLLPPTDQEPGYALSICSADFNEWVAKNASTDAPFSYVWTPEYEIFEWNMGHLANYAELAMLMTPRPFMVERGHDDGVGVDHWVAWEYAKVRRHYSKIGLPKRTEIEFFDGPHTIHGFGTYRFLNDWLRGK